MPKLQKSKEKKAALLKATLQLIHEGGVQAASMSKVAKMANVSPATIYLFFESKQDLINQLYLDTKAAFCLQAFEGHVIGEPVKQSFKRIWFNIAAYKTTQTLEASFLSQCDNTPMIDENSRLEGLKYLQPLLDLWERGQKEEIIKPISPYLLYAYTIYPLAFLVNERTKAHCTLCDNLMQDAFQAAWDSIELKKE